MTYNLGCYLRLFSCFLRKQESRHLCKNCNPVISSKVIFPNLRINNHEQIENVHQN